MALIGLNGLWLAYVSTSGYTPRAQMYEGLNLSAGAKLAVADYYNTHGEFPASNVEALLDEAIEGRFVSDVRVVPGGIIRVTYGGAEADEDIAGKVLTLRAVVDEDSGDIAWSCSAPEVPAKHRPATCR